MKILLTGGAGFIGSHIADNLIAENNEVFITDNFSTGSKKNLPRSVQSEKVDIVDQEKVLAIFESVRPDAVCHQAAQMSVSRSVREPLFDAQVNCIGLIHVLDAAVKVDCKRFVFASSGGVLYGNVTTPAT